MAYTATLERVNNRVTRYEIYRDSQAITYAEVIELWQHDPKFQGFSTSILAESPFVGFRWETPALTIDFAHRQFEFALVEAAGFATRQTDSMAYAKYFTDSDDDHGVVAFSNLGGDATLIVPSPRVELNAYGHLAAFVRQAPREQVDSLWRVLGRTITSQLSAKPIWVSTAGGGVSWLHVRLDSRPKYYSYGPYKSV